MTLDDPLSQVQLTKCFADESIHESLGLMIIAFVFASEDFEDRVSEELRAVGLNSPIEEFKSGSRMEADERMRMARDRLLHLAEQHSRIAVFFGPLARPSRGRQALQALQSILIRNDIRPTGLTAYFDQGMFSSENEARRLLRLFHYLAPVTMFSAEDSRVRVGVQVADAVAHSLGQVMKQAVTGNGKSVDIGGDQSGYAAGTTAPLGWTLLMNLRRSLLSRPVVYRGETYASQTDPVILDPMHDDVVDYGQNPILLGWGVQVAPEASAFLRQRVEEVLGRIWLGCIH